MKEIPPHIKEKIDKLTDELKKVYELAEESWEDVMVVMRMINISL